MGQSLCWVSAVNCVIQLLTPPAECLNKPCVSLRYGPIPYDSIIYCPEKVVSVDSKLD